MPLLNIGITFAIFILDGNTPVLNEILQMCARGLQITDTTFATVSMLISSKSEDLFLVHPETVVMTSSSSTGLINKLCSMLTPK